MLWPNFAFYGFGLNISVCFTEVPFDDEPGKTKACKDIVEDHPYTKEWLHICKGDEDCQKKGKRICAMDPNCYGFMVEHSPYDPLTPVVLPLVKTGSPEAARNGDSSYFRSCSCFRILFSAA